MKILAPKDQLAQGVKMVASLASSGTSLGTQGILIEAEGDSLLMGASDGEVTATHLVSEVKVEKPGRALVDAVLGNLILDLTDETVTLELNQDGTALKVSAQGKDYEVPTSDPDEYRGLERETGGECLVLKSEALRSAVTRTAFVVAKEGARYALHGLLLDVDDQGKANFVGSDGRRLSWVWTDPEEKPSKPGQYLVPKRALYDFLKGIPPEGETVKLEFKGGKMSLEMGRTTVVAQLIEGEYPEYKAVVPKETANLARIPARPFEEALRRIILISSKESPAARLLFHSSGELEISAGMGGKAGKEILEVQLEGEGSEVSFNPVYILEFLRAAGREVVSLGFTDNQVAGKFLGGEDFVHIIMPLTL